MSRPLPRLIESVTGRHLFGRAPKPPLGRPVTPRAAAGATLCNHGSRRTGFSARRLLLALLGWCAGPTTGHAHDPFEAFTTVTVTASQLEVHITLAAGTAWKLIDSSEQTPPLQSDNFAERSPALAKAGERLFILTANHRAVTARHGKVELTAENDLIFTVLYPRPPPGILFISASYLRNLGEGYGGICEVSDETGRHLGWEQLTWARPHFEVTLPAPAPATSERK